MTKRNAQLEIIPMSAAAAIYGSTTDDVVAPDHHIPKQWDKRARLAWDYYITEPIVSACINTWRAFSVGEEVRIGGKDDDIKLAATDYFVSIKGKQFLKDMLIQLLVKGDCIGYRVQSKNNTNEYQCINPVSVKLETENGQLISASQYKEGASLTGKGTPLNVDAMFYRKWNAPSFSPRGNSMVLPAFDALRLLRNYRSAESAIAKRWVHPLRLIKVGGQFGPHLINPDHAYMESIAALFANSTAHTGVVVPFCVTVETHGTEGDVLKVEEKVKEVKEDIMVALGLSRSIITGDGPNFATAQVALKKLSVMLGDIKDVARDILAWLFEPFMADNNLDARDITFSFNDLDPSESVEMLKVLLDLYKNDVISKATLQARCDIDSATENEHITQEATDGTPSPAQIQAVSNLLALEVIDVDQAREMLHLSGKKPTPKTEAEHHIPQLEAWALADDDEE